MASLKPIFFFPSHLGICCKKASNTLKWLLESLHDLLTFFVLATMWADIRCICSLGLDLQNKRQLLVLKLYAYVDIEKW